MLTWKTVCETIALLEDGVADTAGIEDTTCECVGVTDITGLEEGVGDTAGIEDATCELEGVDDITGLEEGDGVGGPKSNCCFDRHILLFKQSTFFNTILSSVL